MRRISPPKEQSDQSIQDEGINLAIKIKCAFVYFVFFFLFCALLLLGFVVHRGRTIPTLASMQEPLVPARLRQAKEKTNNDSKADERGKFIIIFKNM